MQKNRAIVVLGMHRSGTSVITRGLQACGVFLGNNLIESQPDNPTGFWEDREIVQINEDLLALKGTSYQDLALFDENAFDDRNTLSIKNRAVTYLKNTFSEHTFWGFKDPRTVRLLPFWQSVLHHCNVEIAYMIALRDPESAAASLAKRERIQHETAHLLWINYMVPFLSRIEGSAFSVLDYDRFLLNPKTELIRVAQQLSLPFNQDIDHFCNTFINKSLQHEKPNPIQSPPQHYAAELTRDFHSRLDRLHQSVPDCDFWENWKKAAKPALEHIRIASLLHEEKAYSERVIRSALRWQKRSWATRFFHKWRPPSRNTDQSIIRQSVQLGVSESGQIPDVLSSPENVK